MSRSQLAWVNRRGEVVRRIGPDNVNLKPGACRRTGKESPPRFSMSIAV